jgi:hypothetical protein
MGVLTEIGVLSDGSLTQDAKDRFIEDTTLVLAAGGAQGLDIVFDIDPDGELPIWDIAVGAVLAVAFTKDTFEEHQELFSNFHTIHIDIIYEILAGFFDFEVVVPFKPAGIFDPTYEFDLDVELDFPPNFTDFVNPKFLVDLGVDLTAATEFVASLPDAAVPLPDFGIEMPDLPDTPNVNPELPSIVTIIVDILTAIPLEVATIATELGTTLPVALSDFDSLISGIAIKLWEIIVTVIERIAEYISLCAAFIVHLKNIIAMLITGIIGMILGTGVICETVAQLLGLI